MDHKQLEDALMELKKAYEEASAGSIESEEMMDWLEGQTKDTH
jgi:hypothetical protein